MTEPNDPPQDDALGQTLTGMLSAQPSPEHNSVRTSERLSDEEILRRLKRARTLGGGPTSPETLAPPEALGGWVDHYAPGPGCGLAEAVKALGKRLDISRAGPGYQEAYKESRAKYWGLGGGKPALDVAADHGGFTPSVLLELLLANRDLGDTYDENVTEHDMLKGVKK